MKNRKIIIVLFLIILIIVVLLLNFLSVNKTYSYINSDQSISVMVYNTTSNTYVAQNSVPIGDYALNRNLTYCEGTGDIQSYNKTVGAVTTLIDGQDKCYYYFDPITPKQVNISSVGNTNVQSDNGETWTINISLQLCNNSGSNCSTSNTIPSDGYYINNLSSCSNDGILNNYDSGIISLTIKGNDSCLIKLNQAYLLNNYIVSGTSGTHNNYSYQILNEGNGIRYEGKDPANYVCFTSECSDSEKYRIIGTFTEMVDTTGNGIVDTNKSVIKIVKYNSIGNYAWDSNKTSDWSNASLKNYLNNTWTKPTNKILIVRWYLLCPSDSIIDSCTASQFLSYERNGSKYSSNPSYWDGKIALIYPSDYGFSVRSSDCSRSTNMNSYDTCASNNWLYKNSYSWLLTPASYREYTALIVRYGYWSGQINGTFMTTGSYPVLPSFYLDASKTYFSSGSGTISSPYLII